MTEEWRKIEGYEGLYEVSNLGNVRSLGMWVNGKSGGKYFKRGRVLKPRKCKGGYLRVYLCKEGKEKECYIHRLVAEVFLPNPNNLPCVNHISEDKTDNRVENLEFCTYEYNNNYGTRSKRAAEKMKGMLINRTDQSKKIQAFNKNGVLIFEFPSINEASRNGFAQGNIFACCNGKRKTAYGYIWKYA